MTFAPNPPRHVPVVLDPEGVMLSPFQVDKTVDTMATSMAVQTVVLRCLLGLHDDWRYGRLNGCLVGCFVG